MNYEENNMLPPITTFFVQFFRAKTGSTINLAIHTFNEGMAYCIAKQELGNDWTFRGFIHHA